MKTLYKGTTAAGRRLAEWLNGCGPDDEPFGKHGVLDPATKKPVTNGTVRARWVKWYSNCLVEVK